MRIEVTKVHLIPYMGVVLIQMAILYTNWTYQAATRFP